MDPDDIRATNAVEVKWGAHAAGEKRTEWYTDEDRTTLAMLVDDGRFRLDLSDGGEVDSIRLDRHGDYAMWGPGVSHTWEAEEDSTIVTVRWPGE